MNKVIFKIAALSSIAGLLATCSEQQPAAPDLSFEESLQQQLIEAQPGDVIEIPAGTHEMTRSLSLNVSGVTIRGTGIDSSVLSFAKQIQGAEGLLVNADDFVIEDLAIEDTVGDALKINESHNVAVRTVRTERAGPVPVRTVRTERAGPRHARARQSQTTTNARALPVPDL